MSRFERAERLLRPAEVAELFGVSRQSVAKWSREGRLPYVLTPGGRRLYRPEDVRRLLERPE